MPFTGQHTIKDQDGKSVKFSFEHVNASNGKAYVKMRIKAIKTSLLPYEYNITAL